MKKLIFLVFLVENIHLEIVKRVNKIIALKSYLKQDNVAPTPTQQYLFELD